MIDWLVDLSKRFSHLYVDILTRPYTKFPALLRLFAREFNVHSIRLRLRRHFLFSWRPSPIIIKVHHLKTMYAAIRLVLSQGERRSMLTFNSIHLTDSLENIAIESWSKSIFCYSYFFVSYSCYMSQTRDILNSIWMSKRSFSDYNIRTLPIF